MHSALQAYHLRGVVTVQFMLDRVQHSKRGDDVAEQM